MQSRYDKVAETLRLYPQTSQPESSLFISVHRNVIKGIMYLRQAQFNKAEAHIIESLELAKKHTGAYSTAAVAIAPYLAEVYYERDAWEQLDVLLTHRLHLVNKFAAVDARLRTFVALIRNSEYINQSLKAEMLIEHGLQQSLHYDWPRLQACLLHEQVRFQINKKVRDQGVNGQVNAAIIQLEKLWEQHQTEQPSTFSEINHYLLQAKARIFIDQGDSSKVTPLLLPVLIEQENLGNHLIAIRLRILLALAQYRDNKKLTALESIKPALIIAEQQGIVRSFLDEGEVMRQLLISVDNDESEISLPHSFISTLIKKFNVISPNDIQFKRRASILENTVIEPLSERENETLALVNEGQSNKKIALTLGISAETVKWHLKNVYIKLEVSGRVAAINKAKQFGILN